ncbi:MAG: glycerol-3-phosphate 1-O-acyltransferase PlsY [Candidatus Brocadiales bacterium]
MIGETPLVFILGPFVAYLIGSVPFAYIVARVFGGLDIRQHGSGNVGATNVGRVMGWRYGVPVFLLDVLKGCVPVYLAIKYSGLGPVHPLVILCGVGAILGHVFPVYLRFKGGKAAATSVGVFLVLAPKVILGAILVWCVIVAITRYVSLGTILGSIALCVLFMYLHPDPLGEGRYLMGVSVIVALLIIFRHKENIKRLLAGTEPKLGQGSTAS